MPSLTGTTALANRALGASTGSPALIAAFGLNLRDAALLVASFFVLLATPLSLLFGLWGLAAAAGSLAVIVAFAVYAPPELTMRLYRASRTAPDDSQLSSLVDVLTYRAELTRRPDLYVIPSATLSAFSAGTQNHAAIAITEGLLRRLSLAETAAILGHEIAHVRRNDVRLFGLADWMSRAALLMSYAGLGLAFFNVYALFMVEDTFSWWGIVFLFLAPTVWSVVQLWLSRSRELEADLAAVTLTGDRDAFVSAICSIDPSPGRLGDDLTPPIPARRAPYPSLLRSHPVADDRIRQLDASAASESEPPPLHDRLVIVEQPMVSLVGYGPGDMRPRYRFPGLWF